LSKNEHFVSLNGPAFYGLPVNTERLVLERQTAPQAIPANLKLSTTEVQAFDPMMDVYWQVVEAR